MTRIAVCKKKYKLNVIIWKSSTKMIKINYITKEKRKEKNLNWPQVFVDTNRIIITGGSGSENQMYYLF